MVTNDEVLRYLDSMDFPASRDAIVRGAEQAGAPPAVLRALRAMPAVEYGSRQEVARSAATALAPEVTPADLAARARNRAQQRVARHLRRSDPGSA